MRLSMLLLPHALILLCAGQRSHNWMMREVDQMRSLDAVRQRFQGGARQRPRRHSRLHPLDRIRRRWTEACGTLPCREKHFCLCAYHGG